MFDSYSKYKSNRQCIGSKLFTILGFLLLILPILYVASGWINSKFTSFVVKVDRNRKNECKYAFLKEQMKCPHLYYYHLVS